MDLISKLQPLIDSIQFVEGVPYISIKLPKEWIIIKNPNFTVSDVQTKKVIHPNSPNIQLNGCLEFLNQIYEVNQELVLKKEWLKTKNNELKELAASLPMTELVKIIITTSETDEFDFTPIQNNVNYSNQEVIHEPTFKMEKEPDFDDSMISNTNDSTSNQPKYIYNPDTGDMEEVN